VNAEGAFVHNGDNVAAKPVFDSELYVRLLLTVEKCECYEHGLRQRFLFVNLKKN